MPISKADPFPKGWLMRDLKAAIREVESWPEGMRRAHKTCECATLTREPGNG